MKVKVKIQKCGVALLLRFRLRQGYDGQESYGAQVGDGDFMDGPPHQTAAVAVIGRTMGKAPNVSVARRGRRAEAPDLQKSPRDGPGPCLH